MSSSSAWTASFKSDRSSFTVIATILVSMIEFFSAGDNRQCKYTPHIHKNYLIMLKFILDRFALLVDCMTPLFIRQTLKGLFEPIYKTFRTSPKALFSELAGLSKQSHRT
jgi:hypothetical protein